MSPKQINKEVLCVLKHDEEVDIIKVEYLKIDKDLEVEFNNLLNIFNNDSFTAKDIVIYTKHDAILKVLFNKYDYCINIERPYQGLNLTVEGFEEIFISDFSQINELEKKKEMIKFEKVKLLDKFKTRLHANYLQKAYKKSQIDKKILAFSHRRVGWAAPKYKLNKNFSIELKTNFGYGSVSYFYTKINYKGLDIVPFSDWVDYRISRIYEIVQYSSKHRLIDASWFNAMNYIAEACNISIRDEKQFVKKYIIDSCTKLILGLKNILATNEFKLKGYSFLNQERGYIDLKLDGHNLIEFRGEKISGALRLIEPIKKFTQFVEITEYIEGIEACSMAVRPMIIKEHNNLISIIKKLSSRIKNLERKLIRKQQNILTYQRTKVMLRNSMLMKTGFVDEYTLNQNFNRKHPRYNSLKKDSEKIMLEIQKLYSEKLAYQKIIDNLKIYLKEIKDYFSNKETTRLQLMSA